MLTTAIGGGGLHPVATPMATGGATAPPQSTNASSGAFDLSQWMPSECEGNCCGVRCEIRGIKGESSFEETKRIAREFSRHEACIGASWKIEIKAFQTAKEFSKWLEETKEYMADLQNGDAAAKHSPDDGAHVTLGDTFVGSTEKFKDLTEKMKHAWQRKLQHQKIEQRQRLLLAILIVVFLMGACYVIVHVAIERGVRETMDPRARLIEFYSVHNPKKLSETGFLDGLLRKYKGHEAKLFSRLSKKYGEL